MKPATNLFSVMVSMLFLSVEMEETCNVSKWMEDISSLIDTSSLTSRQKAELSTVQDKAKKSDMLISCSNLQKSHKLIARSSEFDKGRYVFNVDSKSNGKSYLDNDGKELKSRENDLEKNLTNKQNVQKSTKDVDSKTVKENDDGNSKTDSQKSDQKKSNLIKKENMENNLKKEMDTKDKSVIIDDVHDKMTDKESINSKERHVISNDNLNTIRPDKEDAREDGASKTENEKIIDNNTTESNSMHKSENLNIGNNDVIDTTTNAKEELNNLNKNDGNNKIKKETEQKDKIKPNDVGLDQDLTLENDKQAIHRIGESVETSVKVENEKISQSSRTIEEKNQNVVNVNTKDNTKVEEENVLSTTNVKGVKINNKGEMKSSKIDASKYSSGNISSNKHKQKIKDGSDFEKVAKISKTKANNENQRGNNKIIKGKIQKKDNQDIRNGKIDNNNNKSLKEKNRINKIPKNNEVTNEITEKTKDPSNEIIAQEDGQIAYDNENIKTNIEQNETLINTKENKKNAKKEAKFVAKKKQKNSHYNQEDHQEIPKEARESNEDEVNRVVKRKYSATPSKDQNGKPKEFDENEEKRNAIREVDDETNEFDKSIPEQDPRKIKEKEKNIDNHKHGTMVTSKLNLNIDNGNSDNKLRNEGFDEVQHEKTIQEQDDVTQKPYDQKGEDIRTYKKSVQSKNEKEDSLEIRNVEVEPIESKDKSKNLNGEHEKTTKDNESNHFKGRDKKFLRERDENKEISEESTQEDNNIDQFKEDGKALNLERDDNIEITESMLRKDDVNKEYENYNKQKHGKIDENKGEHIKSPKDSDQFNDDKEEGKNILREDVETKPSKVIDQEIVLEKTSKDSGKKIQKEHGGKTEISKESMEKDKENESYKENIKVVNLKLDENRDVSKTMTKENDENKEYRNSNIKNKNKVDTKLNESKDASKEIFEEKIESKKISNKKPSENNEKEEGKPDYATIQKRNMENEIVIKEVEFEKNRVDADGGKTKRKIIINKGFGKNEKRKLVRTDGKTMHDDDINESAKKDGMTQHNEGKVDETSSNEKILKSKNKEKITKKGNQSKKKIKSIPIRKDSDKSETDDNSLQKLYKSDENKAYKYNETEQNVTIKDDAENDKFKIFREVDSNTTDQERRIEASNETLIRDNNTNIDTDIMKKEVEIRNVEINKNSDSEEMGSKKVTLHDENNTRLIETNDLLESEAESDEISRTKEETKPTGDSPNGNFEENKVLFEDNKNVDINENQKNEEYLKTLTNPQSNNGHGHVSIQKENIESETDKNKLLEIMSGKDMGSLNSKNDFTILEPSTKHVHKNIPDDKNFSKSMEILEPKILSNKESDSSRSENHIEKLDSSASEWIKMLQESLKELILTNRDLLSKSKLEQENQFNHVNHQLKQLERRSRYYQKIYHQNIELKKLKSDLQKRLYKLEIKLNRLYASLHHVEMRCSSSKDDQSLMLNEFTRAVTANYTKATENMLATINKTIYERVGNLSQDSFTKVLKHISKYHSNPGLDVISGLLLSYESERCRFMRSLQIPGCCSNVCVTKSTTTSDNSSKKIAEAIGKAPKDPADCSQIDKEQVIVRTIQLGPNKFSTKLVCRNKSVIMLQRMSGSVNFTRNWSEYKYGFGELNDSFWIGLEVLHQLTRIDNYRLLVELKDWDNNTYNGIYDKFKVSSELEGYQLNISDYHGNCGDGLGPHDSSKFSTIDVDNDEAEKKFGGSCSNRFGGGWWYYSCYKCNPTGIYYDRGIVDTQRFDGISWKPLKPPTYSFKHLVMSLQKIL